MNTSQTNEKSLLNNIQSHLLKLPVKPVQKQELIALFTQITHYCCEANHWAMLEELLALMDKLQYILKRKPDHITVPLDEQLQNLRALLLFKIRNMTDSRQQLTIPVIPDSPNRQPEEKTIKRNLILNGDFEEDSQAPTHWEATNAGILSRSGKNLANTYSGSAAVVLGKPNICQNSSISQRISITGGSSYLISFALSGSPQDALPAIDVVFFGEEASLCSFHQLFTPLGWGYHTYLFTLEAPATANYAVITFSKSGIGEVYLDLVNFIQL